MWYFKYRIVYWDEVKRIATGIVANVNLLGAIKEVCDYYDENSIEELSFSCLDAEDILETTNEEYKEAK